MVSAQALLASIAVQALFAAATPVGGEPGAHLLETRAPTASIQYCKGTRWSEGCHNANVPINKCHSVVSDYNDKISSIQNKSSSYTCLWYLDYGCEGKSYDNQKDADLSDGTGEFNDSISSYICRPN